MYGNSTAPTEASGAIEELVSCCIAMSEAMLVDMSAAEWLTHWTTQVPLRLLQAWCFVAVRKLSGVLLLPSAGTDHAGGQQKQGRKIAK
jgi:hypothetical protein